MYRGVTRVFDAYKELQSSVWFNAGRYIYKGKHTLPPGPLKVPFLGSLDFLFMKSEKEFHVVLRKMAEKYGDIMTIHVGTRPIVFLNSYKLTKEAFEKQEFAGGKWHFSRLAALNPRHPDGHGIVLSDWSEEWIAQRDVSLKIMKTLGWNRDTTENNIRSEVDIMVQHILEYRGQPLEIEDICSHTIPNIVTALMFGQRYDYDDERFYSMVQNVEHLLTGFMVDQDVENVPWLIHLKRSSYEKNKEKLFKAGQELLDFWHEKIAEGEAKLRAGQQANDFVTLYLEELAKIPTGRTNITENWLEQLIGDFLLAGCDPTKNTVVWAMAYMAKFPEVQRKIQQELDRVVGRKRHSFQMSDKKRLPYTEAALMEVERLASVCPVVTHRAMEDVQFAGYFIPKGTEVWAFNHYQLHDPRVWDSPEELRPERFLDARGRVTQNKYWTPYCIGIRVCLAKQLAEKTNFIAFAQLLHNFNVCFDPNEPEPTLSAEEAEFKGTLRPKPHKLCYTQRI